MCFSVAKNIVIYTSLNCFSSLEDEMRKELGVCVSGKEKSEQLQLKKESRKSTQGQEGLAWLA